MGASLPTPRLFDRGGNRPHGVGRRLRSPGNVVPLVIASNVAMTVCLSTLSPGYRLLSNSNNECHTRCSTLGRDQHCSAAAAVVVVARPVTPGLRRLQFFCRMNC